MEQLVHSGCTDPAQATVHLVIVDVLVSRIQKSRTTGTTILTNGKGHFGPTKWDNWTGRYGTTFKAGPEYSIVPLNCNTVHSILCTNRNFLEFWVEVTECAQPNPFNYLFIALYINDSWLNRHTETGHCLLVDSVLASQNSWHFTSPPIISQQNDVCGTTTEILNWRHVTTLL